MLLTPVRVSPQSSQAQQAPHERARRVADATYGNVDQFNGRALQIGVTLADLSAKALRETADQLSLRYRDRTAWTIKALFALAFLTAVGLELFAHWPAQPHPWPPLVAELAFTAVGLALYAVARRGRWQDSFQDYRAIAEALRIQQQWQQAALDETVADHYLQQHRGELDWIRNAIRTCCILDHAAHTGAAPALADRRNTLRNACGAWIDGDAREKGQIAYFTDRIARNEKRERIATWFPGRCSERASS